MRLFGSERIAPMIERLGLDRRPAAGSRNADQADRSGPEAHGEDGTTPSASSVLQYDDVMNQQREQIYGQRKEILMGGDVSATIHRQMVHKLIETTAQLNFTGEGSFDWSVNDAKEYLEKLCLKPGTLDKYAEQIKKMDEPDELVKWLEKDADDFYAEREALLTEIGIDMREFERVVLLSVIDRHWMDHIDDMDNLRDGIGLRAYGQQNPVQEYRRESYDMFNDMIHLIREETVRRHLPEPNPAPAGAAEGRRSGKDAGRSTGREHERSGQKGRRTREQVAARRRRSEPALPLRQRQKIQALLWEGLKPFTSELRATGAQGTRGKAGWPGFYRRGTTGATARRSGRTECRLAIQGRRSAKGLAAGGKGRCLSAPDCAPMAHRVLRGKQVGSVYRRGTTECARLAGLDELNAGRRYKATARRKASRLAEGALPFGPRTAWHDTTYIYRLRKEMEELWR